MRGPHPGAGQPAPQRGGAAATQKTVPTRIVNPNSASLRMAGVPPGRPRDRVLVRAPIADDGFAASLGRARTPEARGRIGRAGPVELDGSEGRARVLGGVLQGGRSQVSGRDHSTTSSPEKGQ